MIPDLSYVRSSKSGNIYIVRFCTRSSMIAGRLCYVRSREGSRQRRGQRYRKSDLRDKPRTDFECISAFPGDHVYLLPQQQVDDVMDPFRQATIPRGLGAAESRLVAQLHAVVERCNGRLGVIGSYLMGFAVAQTSDVDLVISGTAAWHAARRLIAQWHARADLSYRPWRSYPADVLRAKRLGLSGGCMDNVRGMQWWRHFAVGRTFFSLSYSRDRRSHAIDFHPTRRRGLASFQSLIGPPAAVAPYRLRLRPEGGRAVQGIASACWFLRQGLGHVSGTVRAPVVLIDDVPWLWLDSPKALDLSGTSTQ